MGGREYEEVILVLFGKFLSASSPKPTPLPYSLVLLRLPEPIIQVDPGSVPTSFLFVNENSKYEIRVLVNYGKYN